MEVFTHFYQVNLEKLKIFSETFYVLYRQSLARPLITVLVTAHKRRQYIKKALDSVRAQNIDRSEYEVIVVSNFESSYEGLGNLRWITVDEEGLSPKIAVGFEEARGEVVSILEDDDQWLPDKLRLVRDIMRREYVDLLHNSKIRTYDDRVLPPDEQVDLRSCSFSARVGPGFKGADLRKFPRLWSCVYNNSAMSLRRDFVSQDQRLMKFFKTYNDTPGVDWLLTLYAFEHGVALHVPEPLTLLNTHNYFNGLRLPPGVRLADAIRTRRSHLEVFKFLSSRCKTLTCKLVVDVLKMGDYPYFLFADSAGRVNLRPRRVLTRFVGENLVPYILLVLYSPRMFFVRTLWILAPSIMIRLVASEPVRLSTKYSHKGLFLLNSGYSTNGTLIVSRAAPSPGNVTDVTVY